MTCRRTSRFAAHRSHDFRFHVGYLVLDDRVRVLAVAHDHRKPGYWLPRASD